MKILYVIHQFYPESSSGTERFLLGLATCVQRTGHHADVVTYSFCEKSSLHGAGELLFRQYRYKGISVTAVRHNRVPIDINSSMDNAAIMRFACDILKKSSYDLVHVAHPMRLTSFVQAAVQLHIPYVLTLTDFWILCPKINLRTSFGTLCSGPEAGQACAQLCSELGTPLIEGRLRMARQILQNAAAVTLPSQFAADVVQKEFTQLQTVVIPHGVNLTQIQPNLRSYNSESRIVFAYCGGLSPHKGVHTLVQAFHSLPFERAELHIYGAASAQEKDYEQLLWRIVGNDNRIKFLGMYNQDNLPEVLRAIDVLVIPSVVYETYSFSLHEAIAANVPVIVSDTGIFAEKIQDPTTGLKFSPGDQAGLAQKLRRVIENPTLLNTMKHNLVHYVPPLQEEEGYLYERIYQTARKRPPEAGAVAPETNGIRLNA